MVVSYTRRARRCGGGRRTVQPIHRPKKQRFDQPRILRKVADAARTLAELKGVVETGLLTINHMLEIQAQLIENDAGFLYENRIRRVRPQSLATDDDQIPVRTYEGRLPRKEEVRPHQLLRQRRAPRSSHGARLEGRFDPDVIGAPV